MIFGHTSTSHNINISNNIFVRDGCYQTHPDHGAIAFLRPNSSGIITQNYFIQCPNNIPIFNINVTSYYYSFHFFLLFFCLFCFEWCVAFETLWCVEGFLGVFFESFCNIVCMSNINIDTQMQTHTNW